MNFYDETIKSIVESGHSIDDIDWIGSESDKDVPGVRLDIDEFFDGIRGFYYDNGYGGEEIPVDLKIVFQDGEYLWRNTYDGSEWWEAVKTPTKPTTYVPFAGFVGDRYDHRLAERVELPEAQSWDAHVHGKTSELADARDLDPVLDAFINRQEEYERRMSDEYYWD